MVSCLKISRKAKSISPEAHVDGQYFHQIVCSELVRIIWVIWPPNTHHSTKLFNLFSSTSSHIILNRIENQDILPSTVIQCQTVKSNFSLSSLLARPQKKIFCYYRLIVFHSTCHRSQPTCFKI